MKTYQKEKHICIFKGLTITTFYTESRKQFTVHARCGSGVTFAIVDLYDSEDEGEAVFNMMNYIEEKVRRNKDVVKKHIAYWESQDI